jgi:hypothetical protein
MDHIPVPPTNPEDWSDEQWIAYLKATDLLQDDGCFEEFSPVTRMSRIARTTGGRMVGVAMRTLDEIIYGHRDQPAAVAESPDKGLENDFEVELDLDGHVVWVRFRRES